MGKTVVLAAAAWAIGAVLGYILAAAAAARLRRQIRALRRKVAGGTEKKKMGTMDKVLILEAVILVAYTVADLAVFWHTGAEPATLTTCVFGVCGVENGVMGWIKTTKEKQAGAAKADPVEPPTEREEPPDVGL